MTADMMNVTFIAISLLVCVLLFGISIYKKYHFFVEKEPDQLHEFLPWHEMIQDSVIINRDGSFQVSIRYRGPDMDSATEEELKALEFQLNNAFKRMRDGWGIYAESQRKESNEYHTTNDFPDAVSYFIEEERKKHFSKGLHFESEYYLTFVYLPPEDSQDKLKQIFVYDENKKNDLFERQLSYFWDETERCVGMLKGVFKDVSILGASETLTYLHSTVSPKWHTIGFPSSVDPINLAEMLTDAHLTGGTKPQLGNHHLRIIGIKSYPNDTWPGLFDELNRLNFRYRWVTRFLFMDREEAMKEVQAHQKGWFSKRESTENFVFRSIFKTPYDPEQEDKSAISKSQDAEAAQYEIDKDIAMYGRYTTSIVILADDKDVADENAKQIEEIINKLGFKAVIEDWNAVPSWFGTIPGMCSANVRRPLVSTINLAHMLPISAVWAGPKKNDFLKGPVQVYTETHGNTPFRLSFHDGDLGHSIIIGAPGMGKSVLLGLAAAQGRKYPNTKTYIFDKGGSSRVLTMGVGGQFYNLAAEDNQVSFQPFRNIDNEIERKWAHEWMIANLSSMNFPITPKRQDILWKALSRLSKSLIHQRHLTGFYLFVNAEDQEMAEAIKYFTHDGPYGKLFDNQEDRLMFSRWQTFEMENLMNSKNVIAPTLSYIFHRIEKDLTGEHPAWIYMDECWRFFEDEVFVKQVDKWLRELRKAKASVIFATQNLSDIVNAKIAPTLLQACPSRIFLPNPNALEEKSYRIYESIGLNRQEINMIAHATPKQHYYYKSRTGSRMFQLALGPLAKAYCAATSKEDQLNAINLCNDYGESEFNYRWLQHQNLQSEVEKFKKWGT